MMHVWQFQETKAKLTKFVNCAKDTPQIISRHGKPEIIAMSLEHYNTLIHARHDIVSFFRNSPLCGEDFTFERDQSTMRDVTV